MEYSQVARHPFLIRTFKGSNPFTPNFRRGEYNSSWLECQIVALKVTGSSPVIRPFCTVLLKKARI